MTQQRSWTLEQANEDKGEGNTQSQIPNWYLFPSIFTDCFPWKSMLKKEKPLSSIYCDKSDKCKEVINDLPYFSWSLPLRRKNTNKLQSQTKTSTG